jgi:hypothetical protein
VTFWITPVHRKQKGTKGGPKLVLSPKAVTALRPLKDDDHNGQNHGYYCAADIVRFGGHLISVKIPLGGEA